MSSFDKLQAMSIALDPLEQREYVTKADRELPEDEQTQWILQPLSARDRMQLDDQYIAASAETDSSDQTRTKYSMRLHGRNYAALQKGLKGWKNFKDASGKPVNANFLGSGGSSKLSDTSLSRIPDADRAELAGVILDGWGDGQDLD